MDVEKYTELLFKIMTDSRYKENINYGEPRPGHPEGTVKAHIAELESNLAQLQSRLSSGDYWKARFLIHTHDTFKVHARGGVSITDPDSHASLARAFAAEFTDDTDLLNMIQYHDEGYALWQQHIQRSAYSIERFETLLNTIQNWNLFLAFTIVDGCTPGKDHEKVKWFINEVRKFKKTNIDEEWVALFEIN